MGWYVILRKDLKELVRNKRALALVTIMPLLLFSALGILSNYSLTKTPTVITVVNEDKGYGSVNYGQQAVDLIQQYGSSVDLVMVNESSFPIAQQLVRNGQAVLSVLIPQDFSYLLNQSYGTPNITIYTSSGGTKTQVASQIVDDAFGQISNYIRYHRVQLIAGDNASSILNPITVQYQEFIVKNPFNTTISTPYGGILPALIVLLAVETNVGLIVDSLIGEKERKTLEMLMVTPVSRWGIIIGKTLAVLSVSLLSAIAILVGIILDISLTFSGLAASITPQQIRIVPLEGVALVAILAATVAITQLITAAMSAYATNTKEANASIGLVMSLPVVSMYPLLFSSLSSLPPLAQVFMYLLPFTYSYLLLNDTLIGPASLFDVVYILALVAYTLGLFWITVKLYGREAVIVGGTKRTFGFKRRKSASATPELQSRDQRT
jgi:ABC-2 type transport system permease protein